MRARSVLICLRSSSILTWSELFCSRRSLFCSKSSSILFSSDSTNPFWLSALSESILSGGIPSLNHDAITWHRGTQRMLRARGQRDSGVSNYDYTHNRPGPGILLGCIPDSGAHAPTRSCYPRELLHTHVDIWEEHETKPTQYGVE